MILAELKYSDERDVIGDITSTIRTNLNKEIDTYNKTIRESEDYKLFVKSLDNDSRIIDLEELNTTYKKLATYSLANINTLKEVLADDQFGVIKNVTDNYSTCTLLRSKLALSNVDDIDKIIEDTTKWIKDKLEIYI